MQGLSSPELNLLSKKITGVSKGRRYRVQYRAINEVGNGPWSEIGHILAASISQKPVFISATVVGNKIKVAW